MVRIFLTGASGYVGGEVLYGLSQAKLSGVQIVCLVRDATKAEQISKVHPDVEIVEAGLDDLEIVEREAEASYVVLNLAATGHAASSKAIAKGLQARHSKTQTPSYWVQISGATLYAAEEISSGRYGYASDTIYDDLKDQEQILSVIRKNPKRVVENIILEQSSGSVRTALIIGPLIYGRGRGPVNQRSVQAPEIAKAILNLGHGFKLNDGENIWSNIHVRDIASLIIALVNAALEKKDDVWNEDGVFNAENGDEQTTFKELGSVIAKEAESQNLIKPDMDIETIDAAKADSMSGHAAVLWGTNARIKSSRAQQRLEWKASAPSFKTEVSDLVRGEAESLQGR